MPGDQQTYALSLTCANVPTAADLSSDFGADMPYVVVGGYALGSLLGGRSG
jgi:hypothetical protein